MDMNQTHSGQIDKTDPKLSPDAVTLSLIATGLIESVEKITRGFPLAYPYASQLQRGLDRLVAAQLRRGLIPVQGIPELIRWSQRPLAEWELDLPSDSFGTEDRLLDDQIPTDICNDWSCASPDVEAELAERQFMQSVFEVCRALGDANVYADFRYLLIDQPVLTEAEFQQKKHIQFRDLAEQLEAAYRPAPAMCLYNDAFHCCSICHNLLIRTTKGGLICENERCRTAGSISGHQIPMHEEPRWLNRSLRRFISAPGLAEIRLARKLEQLGLDVELWPEFDRYDLRIKFPNDDVWAIDVKDWANPFILARQVRPIPVEPSWSHAYFVFPNERRKQRPDYMRAFRNHCRILNSLTDAAFEDEIIRKIRKRIEEV